MAHPYSLPADVRNLSNNPRTVDVSDSQIVVEIESADDYIDSRLQRIGNPFTGSEEEYQMVQKWSRRLGAANVIERYNTYNNIEMSWKKAQFFRDVTEAEIIVYLKNNTSTTASMDSNVNISASDYETTEAAIDAQQATIPVYRSTRYSQMQTNNDAIPDQDYSGHFS